MQYNNLKAFIYMQEAETMPPDCDDEWFLQTDDSLYFIDNFDKIIEGIDHIKANLFACETEEEIQILFYDAAKMSLGEDKSSIRNFFKFLYLTMFEKTHGPRWGQFVALAGKEKFIENLEERMRNPLLLP